MGADTRLAPLAELGVAVASIDYRLAPAARFPDPVLDVGSAVNFLRREGPRWNLDVARVGAWGASAGAHLALLAALAPVLPAGGDGTDRAAVAAGDVGTAGDRIDAVVNWFGAVDLVALAARSPLEQLVRPPGPEAGLLGVDDPNAALRAARAASPVNHLRADGPPVLTMHGDRDQMVPVGLSTRLHDALTLLGVDSTLVVLGGAGHEDPKFERPEILAYTAAWLRARLAS